MEAKVKQRLMQFIGYKKLSIREFERLCSLSNGYVKGIKYNILPNKMRNIILQFPELNINWLLTGEGEMLKDNRNGNTINVSGNNSGINVAGSTIQSNDNISGNVIGNNNHVSGSTNNGINIILPEKGYQKIINSTGKETTIHLNNDDISAVASLSIENVSLKEKNELLNQMIADFRERLKEKDEIINMYRSKINGS